MNVHSFYDWRIYMTTNGIHQITIPTPYNVGDVHVYVHIGETVTLFDAGVNTEEAWEAFEIQLKRLKLLPSDIDQVVLTHHHPDHIGFVGRLEHLQGIYGHEIVDFWLTRDESYIQHYINYFNELYDLWSVPNKFRHIKYTVDDLIKHTTPSQLTKRIKEGERIPNLPSFLVIETPGHAESHLSFLDEETGALIGGDFLLKHISSNPLLEPPLQKSKERPKTLLKYRDSMKKILNYSVKTIYPGHGEIFTNHEPLILERLNKQENRAKHVLSFLQKQVLTPFEICRLLFPKHYETQFGLTMSETVGQLDYLQSIDEIEQDIIEGQIVYRAKQSQLN